MARKVTSGPGPYLLHLALLRERIPDTTRFPYSVPSIGGLTELPFHPKVTFLIGENGSGKSTLLEAIAVASGLNPEGGSRNFRFATRASHSSLDEAVRLVRTSSLPGDSFFLRAESFYNVASEIERLDQGMPGLTASYGGTSLHEQSHGESFFALFQHRLRDNGLYLMDEPEAALSPSRQLQFLALLHQYVGAGCQFVIATHSPIILAYPDAAIYLLDGAPPRRVLYRDTEHYQVTRDFLLHPDRSLAILLDDTPPACHGRRGLGGVPEHQPPDSEDRAT